MTIDGCWNQKMKAAQVADETMHGCQFYLMHSATRTNADCWWHFIEMTSHTGLNMTPRPAGRMQKGNEYKSLQYQVAGR